METSLLIFLPRLLDYIRLASEMCLKDLWKKFYGELLAYGIPQGTCC